MAIAYHTHTFEIPTATNAETQAGVITDKVVVPSGLAAALASYVTSTALTTTLADYALSASLGTAATEDVGYFATAAQGALAATAVQPTDIGVSVQAYSANLDEYAAVNPTAAGLALLDDADAAAQRTTLGLGTMATQAASAVAITGGSVAGITDLAVADGGTGASTAADARTNLGLGTMATQAASAVAITGGSIAGITDLAVADGGTGASTAANARTNLGLGSAAVLTAGDASGNLKALNADGGFTFATTATNTNVAGVNAGVWKTAHRIDSTDTATYAGNRTTMAILRGYTGSGENGPTRSDTALHLETEQDNWLTTSVLGEGDTLRIFNRKGVNGDMAGVLINVSKVESASYGSLAWEAASNWVQATTGTSLRLMRVNAGHQGPATDLRGGGVGFNATAMTGNHNIAFAAFEDYTDTGQWKYPFLGADGYLNGDEYFYVTGPAHANGKGQLYTSALATIAGAVAAPAGGSTAAKLVLGSFSSFGIYFGTGAPTVSAAKGSLYLRRDGTTTNNRAYINTDGGTTWTALTTAA